MANETRWNSQLAMVKTFSKAIEAEPKLQESLQAFKKHGKVTNRELKIIKELIIILEPFLDATDEWQRDFESIGSVIPAFCHIRNMMTEFSKPVSRTSICRDVAKELLESLERRMDYVLYDTFYLLGTTNSIMQFFIAL